MSTNSLLRFQSCHSRSLIEGISKGQYLRLQRNCSDDVTFKEQALDIQKRFSYRGYPKKVLAKSFRGAFERNRSSHLVPKPQVEKEGDIRGDLRVIGCFDNYAPDFRNIFEKYWGVLLPDPDLCEILPQRPAITFKNGRSLRDHLVKSHYVKQRGPATWLKNKPHGCFKCGACSFCHNILSTKQFISTSVG